MFFNTLMSFQTLPVGGIVYCSVQISPFRRKNTAAYFELLLKTTDFCVYVCVCVKIREKIIFCLFLNKHDLL